MQIKLPKIIKPLKISEYAPGSEEEIQVWVNPPVALLQEYDKTIATARELIEKSVDAQKGKTFNDKLKREIEAQSEEAGTAQIKILSEIWSQGPKLTHYSVEEIKKLIEGTRDADPMFWLWLKDKTIQLIAEHRNYIKKD
jgi:hypothetical protein